MLFLVPPHCEASMPLLAPAQLASHAEKIKFPFRFVDINACIRERFLFDSGDLFKKNNLREDSIESAAQVSPTSYWKTIDDLRMRLAKGQLFTPEASMTWDGIDTDCPWDDIDFQYKFLENLKTTKHRTSACELFWSFIEKKDFTFVGLSITFASQLLEALAIAHEFKDKLPNIKIIFGGGFINSCMKDVSDIAGPIADIADLVCVGDGELLLSFLSNEGFSRIDKVSKKSNSNAFFLNTSCLVDRVQIPKVPAPIFFKDNISKYISPKLILPYRISSSCYWGRCTFCADHQYKTNLKEEISISVHLDRIEKLINDYSAFGICFLDSAIHPKILHDLSQGITKRGLNFYWGTNARFEKEFLENGVLEDLFEGGCRFLRFGLESASQKILNTMDKGTDIETAGNILSRCRTTSILTHAYTMVGFPGESEIDRLTTKHFLLAPRTHPDFFSISKFIRYKESLIVKDQEILLYKKNVCDNNIKNATIDQYIYDLHKSFEEYFGLSRVLVSPAHTISMYDATAKWNKSCQ